MVKQKQNNYVLLTKSSVSSQIFVFTRNDNFSIVVSAQKTTTHPQRSLARHLGSCSYVKRLLQYSQSKKNKTTTRYFALTSHLLSTHLSSSHYSSTLARTTLGGTLLLLSLHLASASRISYLARCFSRALHLWHACIHYMHALHLASTTVHASLLYLYSSSRASWLHALTSYHTLHFILYLYSVLLGRASSAVVLQRLPNIRCLLFCSAPALQALVQDTRVNLRRTPES